MRYTFHFGCQGNIAKPGATVVETVRLCCCDEDGVSGKAGKDTVT